MESKRKASGANGLETTTDTDRAAKRRKLIEEYGDLADGETSESTTAYGLSILESIRATTDKNGRAVAPYFEGLPSRSDNAQYYKKIRLPLSLEIIERKLKDKQYPTLSTLESDFKRLVSNAKETNDRSSTVFGDAERVRKAVSNLMVKHNPAYKAGNYQAVPTPLPPTPEPEDGGDDEQPDDEVDAAMTAQATKPDAKPSPKDSADDAEVEEEGEQEEQDEGEDEAAGEDGDEGQGDDGEEEEKDESSQPRRRRGSSWRKADPKPSRDSATPGRKPIPRTGKADHYYENIPFSELNFQQAQEKLIEELIRKKEDPDDYAYFEPFVYLPPRTLRDYYEVITEPLSLKALQKQVRGQHGRLEATWVSDFKGWAAFEDQASLIWKNAYHYNEDGSDIFTLAQELEETFHELLKEAKTNVPEPPQPKIKLKLPPAAETPGHHPKKITIHVGGKNSTTGSPAPPTGRSGDSEVTRNETPVNKTPFVGTSSAATSVNMNMSQLDKARSMSASVGPPSPSVISAAKTEDNMRTNTPVPRPITTTFQHFVPVMTNVPAPTSNGTTPHYQQPPPPPPKRSATDILEAQKYRPRPIRESEALMPRLVITTHPSAPIENKLVATLVASATEYQQEIVLNMPVSHFRLQFKPQIAGFLEGEQREWKLNVMHDTARLFPTSVSFDRRGEPVFDITLRYGINRIDVTLIAALPRNEKAPNGLNMEMERFVVHMNLLKH